MLFWFLCFGFVVGLCRFFFSCFLFLDLLFLCYFLLFWAIIYVILVLFVRFLFLCYSYFLLSVFFFALDPWFFFSLVILAFCMCFLPIYIKSYFLYFVNIFACDGNYTITSVPSCFYLLYFNPIVIIVRFPFFFYSLLFLFFFTSYVCDPFFCQIVEIDRSLTPFIMLSEYIFISSYYSFDSLIYFT